MNCMKCESPSSSFNDMYDPGEKKNICLWLCEGCQRRLMSLVKGFLGGRE